jgi:hypothetical protein
LPAKVHAAGAVELHKRSSKHSQPLLPSRSCSREGLHALLANSWPGNPTRLRLTVWNIKKISRPERPETKAAWCGEAKQTGQIKPRFEMIQQDQTANSNRCKRHMTVLVLVRQLCHWFMA